MSNFTIYHNPRCSKSRKTLELLKENGIDPEIVLYLEETPSGEEIAKLLKSLNMEPRELLRSSEAEYKELGLKNQDFSNEQLIQIMSENPKLIERPIVTNNSVPTIGRPPETVLKLIKTKESPYADCLESWRNCLESNNK